MSNNNNHLINKIFENIKQKGNDLALINTEKYFGAKQISWNTLKDNILNIGAYLLKINNKKKNNIGILSNNCLQWTCADLAILTAKLVTTPIYKTISAKTSKYIIDNADIDTFFIDDEQAYDLLEKSLQDTFKQAKIIIFDSEVTKKSENHIHLNELLKQQQCHKEILELKETYKLEDIATLLYTSGTSGDPKGVLLSHRNIASSIMQHKEWLCFNENTTSMAVLPLSHIFERNWSFYVLYNKGTNYYLKDYTKIKQAIAQNKPNVVCVVPRFLEKVYSALKEKSNRSMLLKYAFFIIQKYKKNKESILLSTLFNINKHTIFRILKHKIFPNIQTIPCGGAAIDPEISFFFQANNFPILMGYGLTETTATVTSQKSHKPFNLSCGKPLKEIEVKIGSNNEIMVKSETVMEGYYNNPEANKEAFENGWFKTGDAGFIDKKGFLYITDRIKELMKTSNGKYIAPQKLENLLCLSPYIEQTAIIAEARHFVSALIVPKFHNLEKWAKEQNISYKNHLDLIKSIEVQEKINSIIHNLQKDLSKFEQVKKFTLLLDKFSIELGEITPTFKLRRRFIYKKYKADIQSMYD